MPRTGPRGKGSARRMRTVQARRLSPRRFTSVLVLAAGLFGRAASADDAEPTADEEAAFYRWWDGLGFPDVVKAPFVEAATADWTQEEENGPKTPVHQHAFLVADEGATFVLFTTDLRETRWTKTPPGRPEVERVGHAAADLAAFVRAGVARLRAHEKPVEWHERWKDPGVDPFDAHRWAVPDQSFRLLVLARACAGRGAPDLAHDLCTLALREAGDDRDTPRSTAQRLDAFRKDIAAEARVAFVERLGDRSVSLERLRVDARRLSAAFPDDAESAEDAKVLDRMIAEDAQRAARPPAEPTGLPGRLDDWVFRLREEAGPRWADSDGSRPQERGGTKLPTGPSPRERLREAGFAAVPRLLEALSDRTFTRSVLRSPTGHGQIREPVQPYRVRDAAIDLLDEIAAGGFRDESGSAFAFHWKDEQSKVDERAREWWKVAQAKGEEATLAETVAKGGRASVAPARRLAAAYPGSALDAIRRAVAATSETWAASQLVEIAAGVPGDAATAFFLDLLEKDARLGMRLTAARALRLRGRREGVVAMTKEWRHPTPHEAGPRPFLPADPMIDGNLLAFLASSGDAEAYRALAEGLGKRSIGRRFAIVGAFLEARGGSSAFAIGSDAMVPSTGGVPAVLDPAAQRVLEDLLGERLGDQSGVEDVWMTLGEGELDTRLGHVAARALSERFPARYRYDPKASPAVREAQRLAEQNLWRAAHGLAPVPPVPERPRPARVPDAAVAPILDRFLAKEGEERAAAGKEVEALGIGALPAVLARAKATPREAPARKDLDALAARLASVVTDVVVGQDSLPPDAPFAAVLDGIRGKPFVGETFVRLVTTVLRAKPAGAVGIRLSIARGDDLKGALVVVTLEKNVVHGWGGHEPGWSQLSTSGPNVRIGGRSHGGRGGGMNPDFAADPDSWKDEGQEVETALATPPDVPVTIGVAAVREE